MLVRQPPVVLAAQSAVAASVTGTTNETTLTTITIPGGLMGANGRVEIEAHFTIPSNANAKLLRVLFGGTAIVSAGLTTNVTFRPVAYVANRNNVASQIANPTGGAFSGASNSSAIALAVNTNADVTILITGTLGNAADTITLESYSVRVFPKG